MSKQKQKQRGPKPVLGTPETLDEMPDVKRGRSSQYDAILDSVPETGALRVPVETGNPASVAQGIRNRAKSREIAVTAKSRGRDVYVARES